MVKYGISKDTVEIGGGKFIQVDRTTAISTGRYLENIEYGVTDNGNKFIEVTVREKDGKTASRKYFEPTIDGNYVKTEEELEKVGNKFNTLMANLTRRFLGDNYVVENVSSFEEYCKRIAADIKRVPGWDKKEMRVKVVLNKDDYPTLPGYAPAFEDASVPLAESKLKIGQYDKVESDNVTPDADTNAATEEDLEDLRDKF